MRCSASGSEAVRCAWDTRGKRAPMGKAPLQGQVRMPYSVEPSDSERQGAVVVVPETADAALLNQPLRCLADVEAIERTPLDRRLGVVDISQRIALGLAAHDPSDTAIFYVSDGDVDRPPVKVPFSELRGNIDNTGALLRVSGIGRGDVVAVLLPTVPPLYLSILAARAAGTAVA